MELEGQVALVTGASRGIGRAIALKLAEKGARVFINYRGSGAEARQVAEKIREAGGAAEEIGCDVSDFHACEEMTRVILQKCGRLDILVNNAGITRDNLLVRMQEEDFDRVIGTNLKGAFHTTRFFARQFLKQRSGRIINITSVSGIMGNPGQANYAASKAGVIGLTKSTARELAGRGICVNAVAPGFVETEMCGGIHSGGKNGNAGGGGSPCGISGRRGSRLYYGSGDLCGRRALHVGRKVWKRV